MTSGGDAATQPSGDDPEEATGSGGVAIRAGDDDDATGLLDGAEGSASVSTPAPSVSSAASEANGAPPTTWHVPPTTSEMAPPVSNVTNDTTTGAANGTSGCEFRHVWYVDKRGRNDYRKGQVKNGYCWHGAFSTLTEALGSAELGDEVWASRRHAPRWPGFVCVCCASSSRPVWPWAYGARTAAAPTARARRPVFSSLTAAGWRRVTQCLAEAERPPLLRGMSLFWPSCQQVAQGTYYPGDPVEDYSTGYVNGSREQSFDLPVGAARHLRSRDGYFAIPFGQRTAKNKPDLFFVFPARQVGITIYGSFVGSEHDVSERPSLSSGEHATLLSGDIGGRGNSSDNSYHVVLGAHATTMDGVHIAHGRADGDDLDAFGGGVLSSFFSSMTFREVVFYDNAAKVNCQRVISFDSCCEDKKTSS